MTDLRDARSRIIEAADAERRRIERDLHDGAQQRLVALALTLRMAEKRAAEGEPEAAELVRQAGDEAGLALKDLRDLARGIHPAILTNRGLPAALRGPRRRAPPCRSRWSRRLTERLPDQVEAAAYFVVSECLANVDKHAAGDSRDGGGRAAGRQADRDRQRRRRRRRAARRRVGAAGPARTASGRWRARSPSRARRGRGPRSARPSRSRRPSSRAEPRRDRGRPLLSDADADAAPGPPRAGAARCAARCSAASRR